ncbi:MAG TPA: hypothetical protein VFT79_02655 [Solirubrobacterales bacterium]|nr:hypothetical protein [Solirubrobacterales bacterium]
MCDVLNYIGENLAGPVLAALIGGPLVAVGFRYFEIPKEVADHDARVIEFNMNLRRWIGDRNRQLERELRALVNQAGSGIVSRYPVPQHTRPRDIGSQLDSGALTSEAIAGMRQALHEYRDEASSRVTEFSAIVRSEGRWHRWYRKRNKRREIKFWVRDEERGILASWRSRPHPLEKDKTIFVDVGADPSIEPDIAPLEEGEGLTWEAAKRSPL